MVTIDQAYDANFVLYHLDQIYEMLLMSKICDYYKILTMLEFVVLPLIDIQDPIFLEEKQKVYLTSRRA